MEFGTTCEVCYPCWWESAEVARKTIGRRTYAAKNGTLGINTHQISPEFRSKILLRVACSTQFSISFASPDTSSTTKVHLPPPLRRERDETSVNDAALPAISGRYADTWHAASHPNTCLTSVRVGVRTRRPFGTSIFSGF